MYFNHATAGALAVRPIIKKYEGMFTKKEINMLWFIGITSSVLPDFDIAYSVIKNLNYHRSFITHGVILYLIAFVILYFLSYFQKKEIFGRRFFKTMALVFLVGVLTHFVIDFLVGGIALFAPISYKIFGFDMILKNESNSPLLGYLVSKYMIFEFFVTALFLKVFKREKLFAPKFIAFSYLWIALISFMFVSFLIP